MRKSNYELLRIVAMLMIVAHHFGVHSGFGFSGSVTVERAWVEFTQMWGEIGVDIFVLISGYFLINAEHINIKKAVKMWLQIVTYSVGIYLVMSVLGLNSFNVKHLIKSFMPITYTGWWFASTYFIMYLICPYINRLLNSLDKHEYRKMLALATIMWCVVPTFLKHNLESNNLIWFIYLYSIAGYIRLYVEIGGGITAKKAPLGCVLDCRNTADICILYNG